MPPRTLSGLAGGCMSPAQCHAARVSRSSPLCYRHHVAASRASPFRSRLPAYIKHPIDGHFRRATAANIPATPSDAYYPKSILPSWFVKESSSATTSTTDRITCTPTILVHPAAPLCLTPISSILSHHQMSWKQRAMISKKRRLRWVMTGNDGDREQG